LSGEEWLVSAVLMVWTVPVAVREGREAEVEELKVMKVPLRAVVEGLLGLWVVGRIRVSHICTDRSHRPAVTAVVALRGEGWVEVALKLEVVVEVRTE